MQLKSQVEWALHCCAVMGGLPPGQDISTKALAESHGIPKEYLSKALQSLSSADLVESALGPSGGYRLSRAADEMTFLDIVEAVEGPGLTFACSEIRKNNPCRSDNFRDKRSCPIARVMWKADKAWRDALRAATLADLGQTLLAEVPEPMLQASVEWFSNRK